MKSGQMIKMIQCSSSSPPNNTTDDSSTTNPIETSQPSCSWKNCPNKHRRVPLQSCARCKTVFFCGRSCQKKAWGAHKHRCFSTDTPRHRVMEFTVEAIQSAMDRVSDGAVIALEKGTYEGSKPLLINKCLTLLGAGKELTKLNCEGLIVKRTKPEVADDRPSSITVADLEVTNSSKIESSDNKSAINVCNVRFSCPIGNRNDAVEAVTNDGSISFIDCDITGGSDGLGIYGNGVHLTRTTIRHAQHRGIFSRYDFVIENSTISHCGAYGIKGTAGWSEKGKNRIQSGPWSSGW